MTLHCKAKPRRREAGYTVIELLVVLGIMGLVFAIAAPQIARVGNARQVSADQVRAKLEAMRRDAMARGRTLVPEFETAGVRAVWEPSARGEPGSLDRLTFFPDGTVTPGRLIVTTGSGRVVFLAQPWSGRFVREASHAPR